MSVGAAAGTVTGPPPAVRRPGFIAEIADGVAGALLSAPGLASAVLAVATLLLPAPLGICAAHAGGIAFVRVGSGRRPAIVSAWIGLATLQWFSGYGTPSYSAQSGEQRAIVLAVCAMSFAWASRSRAVGVAAVVLTAAADCAVWRPRLISGAGSHTLLGSGERMEDLLWQLGFAAAVFVLVALGRRGWTIAAIVVVAAITLAGLVTSGLFRGWTGHPGYAVVTAVSLACGFVALLVPVVCGMAARAADRGAAADDGARFVLALARWPWRSASALGVVLFATMNSAEAFVPGGTDPASQFALLGRLTSASALLVMVASGAAGSVGALAPLCTASVFALGAWTLSSLVAGSAAGDELIAHRAVRCAAYLLPQLAARAALAAAPAVGRLTMPLVAVAVVLPPAVWSAGIDASPWTGVAWVLVVTAVCVAAAVGDRPAAQIVAGAVVLGLVQRLAMELVPVKVHAQLQPSSWFELPIAWMLASVFVVIARRARTMTAVPLDHPVFVDFPRRA